MRLAFERFPFIAVFVPFPGELFLLFGREEFVENRDLHFLIRL